MSKEGILKKRCIFVFVFFMLNKAKEKDEKMRKGKFQTTKKTESSGFWVAAKKKGLFVKMAICRKIGKHYLCSEGKKNVHLRCNYLFLENDPHLCPFKVTKHYKNRGFSKHRRKPKWHFWLQKCHFGKGPRKGA